MKKNCFVFWQQAIDSQHFFGGCNTYSIDNKRNAIYIYFSQLQSIINFYKKILLLHARQKQI